MDRTVVAQKTSKIAGGGVILRTLFEVHKTGGNHCSSEIHIYLYLYLYLLVYMNLIISRTRNFFFFFSPGR